MTPELLINAAWAVTLWAVAVAGATALLGKAAAVVRRNVCRIGLAGVPVVLAGAVVGTCWRPAAGLILRPPDRPAAAAQAMPPPHLAPPAAARPEALRHEPLVTVEARPPAVHTGAPAAVAGPPPAPRPAASAGEPPALGVNWPAVVVAAAAAFAAGMALLLAWRLLRLAAWRRTWQRASPAWVSLTRRLARRTAMGRPFDVFIVRGLTQPAAAGMFRAAIVLPERAPRSLGPALRSALAHELGHLGGWDPLWYVVGRGVVALAWWCPAVWWLRRRAEIEAELAADDHALACGVRPIELAKTLARCAEWGLRPAPAGVSGMACHLTRRIEMILNPGQSHRSRLNGPARWLLTASAALMGLAVLATPLVGVARAQADDDELKRPPAVREDTTPKAEPRRERVERARDGEGEGRERRREGEREGAERRREGEREGDRDRRVRMSRDLMQMIAAVKITDEQEQEIKKMLRAKEQAVVEWRRKNQARIREAEEVLRRAQEALRRLRNEQNEVAAQADAKVMSVFTPQQRALWATTRIAKMYDRRNAENPMVLTNRQLDDIDVLCEKAQKELIAAEKKPAEAARAKEEILGKLQREIYEKVLDDDQRRRSPRPRGVRGREREGERRREGEGGRREERPDRERRERERREGEREEG